MMQIDNKFNLGQIVYLITDEEQKERMVVGIQVRPIGIIYLIQHLATETFHYEIEITNEIDTLKKLK